MSKYYIYQDTRRCIGCFSCESHCKMKNNLPVISDDLIHLQKPDAIKRCPTGAIVWVEGMQFGDHEPTGLNDVVMEKTYPG